jgi:uncharacterized protein
MGNIYKTSDSISSSKNLPIRYDLYSPGNSSRDFLPVLIFVHGFKGFKDWGPFPDACEDLSRQGFVVIAMNFSMNGIGDNPTEFDRLDLFEKGTLSQDLDDIGIVIEAVKSREIQSSRVGLHTDYIGIIGHSRGGHTAIAAAAEFPEIQCLVTWSAVANYNERWSDQMIKDWKEKGYTEIKNARTGQMMKLGKVVYDDAIENADRLMAVERVKELHLPALFIAGKEDESVPHRDSEKLYRNCPSATKELRLISDTGHTFGASHPFEDDDYPEKFSEVLELTEGWFLDNLA